MVKLITLLAFISCSLQLPAQQKKAVTAQPDSNFTTATNLLNEVVVTGVASATSFRKNPAATVSVSGRAIRRTTSTNIIDALVRNAPGLTAMTTGPNISKPFIRGLGYNRVLTLYDGIRQEGQQWGDEHGIEVDHYGIERAEIIKGPASLVYGSDAIAGVVNLLPENNATEEERLKRSLLVEYQGNHGLAGISFATGNKANGNSWKLRISNKMAADYHNKVDGYVYNTGFREFNVSAMKGWEKARHQHYFYATAYRNLQEIPDGSRDSLTRAFTYQVKENHADDIRQRPIVPFNNIRSYHIAVLHQDIQHYRLYTKNRFVIGGNDLLINTGWQQNIRKEYNHPTIPEQPGLSLVLHTFNYDIKYLFKEVYGTQLTAGLNGMYQLNKNGDATDFPIPDYHLFDAGAYLIAKKELGKCSVSGGIRLDNRWLDWHTLYTRKETGSGFDKRVNTNDTSNATLRFSAFNTLFKGISGSIGITYNPLPAISLKANMAKGYRSPNITEIGSAGLDPGAHIYYIGNKNFVPEYNWQYDIGAFFSYPDADMSVSVFDNYISKYIFLQKQFDTNGQPLEIIPGNATYQYKQGSARLYGMETTLSLHPKNIPFLTLENRTALITGLNMDQESLHRFGNNAKYLPLIPPSSTATSLRFNFKTLATAIKDGYVQVDVETTGTQQKVYAVDETETITPGYTLTHLSIGASLLNRKGVSFCQVLLAANNLFDVAYQSHLNRLKYFEYYSHSTSGHSGIYNMGRNFCLRLIFQW